MLPSEQDKSPPPLGDRKFTELTEDHGLSSSWSSRNCQTFFLWRKRQWWIVPQFVDWRALPSFLQLAPELYFMQDGAPAHWSQRVRNWLNEPKLGWPLSRKMWSSRPQQCVRGHLVHLIWILWFFICGFISRTRFM